MVGFSCFGNIELQLPLFDRMMEEAMKVAVTIASKSPVAVQTAKQSILYSQDHTIAEGLEHIVSHISVNSERV